MPPGSTCELRRPGDAGSGAGLSSPRDHLKLKVSTQPRGFVFGLRTWQEKGEKTFLVFKPKVALGLYEDLNCFGVKEVGFQAPKLSKALGSRDIWKLPVNVSHLLFHPRALLNGASFLSERLTQHTEEPLEELLTSAGSASHQCYSGFFPAMASLH